MKDSLVSKTTNKIIVGIAMNRFLMLTFLMLLMCMLLMSTNIYAAVIQIDTIEELQLIGNDDAYPLVGEYELTQDIDASDTINWNKGLGFKPIGSNSYPFAGKFNGNGHKITNLHINRPAEKYIGLFGYLGKATEITEIIGEVTNLKIEDCSITGNTIVGGLAGMNDTRTINGCYVSGSVSCSGDNVGGLVGFNSESGTISGSSSAASVKGNANVGGLVGNNEGLIGSNSYNTGTVEGTSGNVGNLAGRNSGKISDSYSTGSVNGSSNVGGLVGLNYDGAIENSYSTGSVKGTGDYVGGLVGYNYSYSTISNSYSTGPVNGTGDNVGGLVGRNYDNSIISNSYSTGPVNGSGNRIGGLVGWNYNSTISNSYSTGPVNGAGIVGGLVGYNDYISTISNSYSTGPVNGSGARIGGLVGYNYNASTVLKSYSVSSVIGLNSVGGFVGRNEGTITDGYSMGSVKGTGDSDYVGGLVGYNTNKVNNCYSTGFVESNGVYVGGLVGYNYGGTVLRSYWDKETSGQTSSAEGIGKTTAQMKQQATYVEWDFTAVWEIVENVSYPYLQGFPPTATITILGNAELNIDCKSEYVDAGATANDTIEGDLTSEIQAVNNVNSSAVGDYTVVYSVMDSGGRTVTATRTVHVVDRGKPTITLLGDASVIIECKSVFTDPSATAEDNCDSSVSITKSGNLDVNSVGTYTIIYTATDASGNTADVTRTVEVVDTQKPTITLLGANPLTVECGSVFADPGATVSDNCDSSVELVKTGSVNMNVIGEYTLTYAATDASGNIADSVVRTVEVVDMIPPIITLNGANPMVLIKGTSYSEPGATASDLCSGQVSVEIVSNNVDTNQVGEYQVVYRALDGSGNPSTLTRTVKVVLMINVPDVVNKSESEARGAILSAGLVVGKISEEYSDTVQAGKVIRQSPVSGTQVEPGSSVDIVISKGSNKVKVPDVAGKTEAEAISAIAAVGLNVSGVSYQCSDSVAEGNVISQSPEKDLEVIIGSSIDLWVSTGACIEGVSDVPLRAYAGVGHNYIEWDARLERDILGYRLYRGESENGPWIVIIGGAGKLYTDTSYRDSNVEEGKVYWYRLEIEKQGGKIESIGPVKVEGGKVSLWISDIEWLKDVDKPEIRVPVNIGNALGLNPDTMDIDVSYDSDVLEAVKVEKTAVTADMQIFFNVNEAGLVQMGIVPAEVSSGVTLRGEGHLFDIVFKVKDTVSEDKCISLDFVANSLYDPDNNPVPVEVKGGSLCIRSGCVRGDMNSDKKIEIVDAKILLQGIVKRSWGNDLACNIRRGDMNGDGILDVADVTMLMRWSVGLDINPPQGEVISEKLLSKMVGEGTDVVIISKSPSGSELSNFGVPVELSSIGGLSGMEIAITYGNGLTYKGVDLDTKVTGFNKEEFLGDGYVRVSIGGKEAVGEDVRSQVMVFKFDIAAASGESKEERSIQIREVRLKGQYGDDFRWYGDVKRQDGVITVCPAIKDMRGMTWDEVTDWLIAAGYKPDKREEGDLNVAVGMVIGTEPGSGQILSAGSKVVVIVNKGATAEQLKEEIKNKFGTLDENGDDLLSWEEISSKYSGVLQDTFNSLDSDADGKLSKTESGVIEQEGEGEGQVVTCGCGCSGDKGMPSFDGIMKYLLDFLLVGFLVSLMSAMKKQL